MSISPPARIIFLSPTEHDLKKVLPDAIYSTTCEPNGCDIIVATSRGLVGFQRKTLADLASSLNDGRFAMQLAQQRSSRALNFRFLILEYDRARTTSDGRHFLESSLSPQSVETIGLKLFLNGTFLIESTDLGRTVDIIERVASYVESDGHDRLNRPKPNAGPWGTRSNRDWGIHILQSFPGIGSTTAGLIYDRFGVPFKWSVDEKDLTSIPGIGKVIAKRLLDALK